MVANLRVFRYLGLGVLFFGVDLYMVHLGALSGLIGGVMFPVKKLPGWLKPLFMAFLLTCSMESVRLILLQMQGLAAVWQHVGAFLGEFEQAGLVGGAVSGILDCAGERFFLLFCRRFVANNKG